MERPDALAALAALAQENRLDIFRLLVEAGRDGMPAGAVAEALVFAENNLLLPRIASSAAAPAAKASARANTFNPDLFILPPLPSLVIL